MAALTRTSSGPSGIPAPQADPKPVTAIDVQGGFYAPVATSVSEGGDRGRSFSAHYHLLSNARDIYTLGGLWQNEEKNDGDHFENSEHSRYLLQIGRGEKNIFEGNWSSISHRNLYAGIGETFSAKTWELGSDIFSGGFFYRSNDTPFGFRLMANLSQFVGLPRDEEDTENSRLIGIQAGVSLAITGNDNLDNAPPAALADRDVAYQIAAEFHRLLKTKWTADVLGRHLAVVSEGSEDIFGDSGGGLPSPRLKDASFLNLMGVAGGASEENAALKKQLAANEKQRPWLIGSKVITSVGALLMGKEDPSNSLVTLGLSGGLELLHYSFLDSDNFLMMRLFTSLALFAGGKLAEKEMFGGAALISGHQGLLASVLLPDRNSEKFQTTVQGIYEWNKDGGKFFGALVRQHLPDHLFTELRVLMQGVPGSETLQSEGADEITGRNPLYDAAKAKTVAGIGLETEGETQWNLGAHALLLYGEGAPLAGAGLQVGVHSNLGKSKIELGIDFSADIINGNPQIAITPALGGRF